MAPGAPAAASSVAAVVPPAAPATARGYARAFARLGCAWGAADIALSVELTATRRVWLFGDTLSECNGFVHSTAVTQDGGDFHVSNAGRQVLPDVAGGRIYYWPETVERASAQLLTITSREIRAGEGPWGFRPTGRSRSALVRVTPVGNLLFVRWTGYTRSSDPGYTRIIDANHYGYGLIEHESIPVRGGHLVTESQNWDDALQHHREPNGDLRYADWAPIFSHS